MAAIIREEKPESRLWSLVVDGVAVGSGHGIPWKGQIDCREYETEDELYAAHPELEAPRKERELNANKEKIDKNARINIDKAHLAKAHEAELIKFEGITTPHERFPHLYQEALDKNMTMEALADIVWEKHVEEAQRDNLRILDKGQVS